MAPIPMPKTQKEAVAQIWQVLIGDNGDGVAAIAKRTKEHLDAHVAGCADDEKRLERVETAVADIQARMLTREEHEENMRRRSDIEEAYRRGFAEAAERRQKRLENILKIGGGLLGGGGLSAVVVAIINAL